MYLQKDGILRTERLISYKYLISQRPKTYVLTSQHLLRISFNYISHSIIFQSSHYLATLLLHLFPFFDASSIPSIPTEHVGLCSLDYINLNKEVN